MSRLSLQVFYLWLHVFAPLHRSSPFIGGLRCQAIQTEHGPYIAERTQKAVYIVRCLWATWTVSSCQSALAYFLGTVTRSMHVFEDFPLKDKNTFIVTKKALLLSYRNANSLISLVAPELKTIFLKTHLYQLFWTFKNFDVSYMYLMNLITWAGIGATYFFKIRNRRLSIMRQLRCADKKRDFF
jgi:hypothetical protein